MPSTNATTVPGGAAAVARRYRRLERPVSGGVALLVGVVVAAAFLSLSFVNATVVAAVVLVVARVPVFRSDGRAELTTDADSETVRADFVGAMPPPLALQWGVADEVRATEDGAVYDLSYLFGLRSVTVAVETEANGEDVELAVTAAGRPWATYTASIADRDGETAVTVEWSSDRRFGLRRLPQWAVARRYRETVLTAQGYTVVERRANLGV